MGRFHMDRTGSMDNSCEFYHLVCEECELHLRDQASGFGPCMVSITHSNLSWGELLFFRPLERILPMDNVLFQQIVLIVASRFSQVELSSQL